jgi:hypothetical protein
MQFFKFAFALSVAAVVMAETCFPPGQSCEPEPANCCEGRCEPSDGDLLVSEPPSNVSCEFKVVFVSVHCMIGPSLAEHIMI